MLGRLCQGHDGAFDVESSAGIKLVNVTTTAVEEQKQRGCGAASPAREEANLRPRVRIGGGAQSVHPRLDRRERGVLRHCRHPAAEKVRVPEGALPGAGVEECEDGGAAVCARQPRCLTEGLPQIGRFVGDPLTPSPRGG